MNGRRLGIKLRIGRSVFVSSRRGTVEPVRADLLFTEEFGDPFDESEGKQGNGK